MGTRASLRKASTNANSIPDFSSRILDIDTSQESLLILLAPVCFSTSLAQSTRSSYKSDIGRRAERFTIPSLEKYTLHPLVINR